MYRPPAVRYEVAQSGWHLVAAIFLCAVGAVATEHFILQTTSLVFQWVAAGTLACAVLLAAWGWQCAPRGTLRWDGTYWHWTPWGDVPVAQLQVVMDLQIVVVLGLRSESRQSCRLWLARRKPDATWRAMRRALVAHQRHPTPQRNAYAGLDERASP